jgi:hypothetical protein
MFATALWSLVALLGPSSSESTSQESSGVYVASVTINRDKCSYGIMDVVGLNSSELVASLTGYHSRSPEIGLVIWVSTGTPPRCVGSARRAAKAAGYLTVAIQRQSER